MYVFYAYGAVRVAFGMAGDIYLILDDQPGTVYAALYDRLGA
jgi:hypothetical protein